MEIEGRKGNLGNFGQVWEIFGKFVQVWASWDKFGQGKQIRKMENRAERW